MKHFFLIIISIFFVASLYGQNYDCYTIAVGKKASKQGVVMVGHNEDDWGNKVVNLFKVPEFNFEKGHLIKLHSGKSIKEEGNTNSYILIETTTEEFGDVYLNEHGVFICSNSCPSKEDKATGLLGYQLRHLIAEKAHSAKEGVRIAGKLISKYGYYSSGRTYIIADTSEIWILAVVKGKHWVAQRVPDDQVAIIPNYYTIEEINLKDTANFLGSRDVVRYAIKRKWYNPKSGKPFNFREAYGSPSSLYSIGNVPRHWAGYNLLAKKKVNYNEHIPFSFYPDKKILKADIHKVLSFHYEWTDFETNYKIRKNPHQNIVPRICNAGTKFSVIAVLQPHKPIDYGCVLWFSPLNPCIHPAVPIFFGIRNFPTEYQTSPYGEAMDNHFDKNTNSFEANPNHAFSIFEKLNKFVNNDYLKNEESLKSFQINFENKVNNALKNVNEKSYPLLSYDLLKLLYKKEKQIFKQ